MLRIALVSGVALVALVCGWSHFGGTAQAQPAFKKYFDQKYFPAEGETAMKKAHENSSCNFCHIGGTDDRKHRNEYGQALSKFLKVDDAKKLTIKVKMEDPDAFKAAEDKVAKALETVEKSPSDPKKKDSPTFGELLKSGKLPKSPAKLPE